MTAVLGHAPGTAASEVPAPATAAPTTGGPSEATLIACALTGHAFGFAAHPGIGVDSVSRIVRATRAAYSDAELLAWQDRAPATEWSVRWRAARDLTARLYPDLPGARSLPDVDAQATNAGP